MFLDSINFKTVQVFRVPKDKKLKEKQAKSLKIDHFSITNICEKHFQDNQIKIKKSNDKTDKQKTLYVQQVKEHQFNICIKLIQMYL